VGLTAFQRDICRLIAQSRIASGESYVAGAAALNEVLAAPRISADVDLFHDTASALEASWQSDRQILEQHGFKVRLVRERPSFVEAEVVRGGEGVLLQWVRDSAYRFFPLVEHAEFGLTLHPLDLATNKVLALVGRLEVRDWVDVIECDNGLQPLGYLAWAACSKDPGFSPASVLEHATRSGRYSADEVRSLAFSGPVPDAAQLAARWRAILSEARATIALLPPDEVGKCVLDRAGGLFRSGSDTLAARHTKGEVMFHAGAIRGALPQIARQ
jgi:hypothetical protein